jgi:hypothetical protein
MLVRKRGRVVERPTWLGVREGLAAGNVLNDLVFGRDGRIADLSLEHGNADASG